MNAEAPSLATYKPVTPLNANWSATLSQDVITTATIPVDSASPAPVAVFTNPSSSGIAGNNQVEALAIVNSGAGRQICHIARDQTTDGGWRATPLFGGRAAEQVAGGVAYAGTAQSAVYGLFAEADQLYSTTLGSDGLTWSAPAVVPDASMLSPRVAYSPMGRMVLYGANAKGDLVTAYQEKMGGPFVAVVCSVQGALGQGDFQLCMTDEESFTILANINAAACLITGILGARQSSSLGAAPQFTEKLKHVALGYWSPVQETLIFLLVSDDNALHAWSQNSANSSTVAQKIAHGSISQATGHVSLDNSLHVYAIDANLGLWVLHQSSNRPWQDDGTPNWAPFLPLDKGVGRVVSDMNPAAAPSLFALDGGDYSLRLHAQDAGSRLWKSQNVLQHAAKAYEVARYRAEIRIVDAHGRALPKHAVTVATEKGGSAVEVWAGGCLYQVDEDGAALTTDATGKLTVAILAAGGLICPNLVVSGAGLPSPVTIKPAGAVHEYLSGNGTLNPTNPGGPLPVFSSNGDTLAKATVGGKPLAPGASDPQQAAAVAAAIQHGARVALGNPSPGILGFGGSLLNGNPTFEVFQTREALQVFCESANLTRVDGFWDDLKDFFGDLFEGIKNAVIAVAHFVVDVARAVVNFTLQIAEWTAQALDLPIDGIEKAASFMNGVFNSVDAGIDKVVDWLKALFDFSAIWRTKMAIEQGVLGVPAYVKQVALLSQKAADRWFGKQKKIVNKAFDAAKARYAGQAFSHQKNWQNPCAPASGNPVAGGAAASDFTDNSHHNWLQDKVSSYAPDDSGLPPNPSVSGPWDAFATHMQQSGTEFLAALDKFKDAVLSLVQDPSSFATTAIPDLIDMVRLLADALLDLCDAIVDAIAGLAVTAMDALESALNTELQLGFLNTLWSWIADLAGYPKDGKLTLCALGALAAAFPCTLIYKLVAGVEHEPFPDGKFPEKQPALGAAAGFGIAMPWGCVLASDIVRIVQVIPAGIADFLGNDAPWWLSIIGLIWSIAVWVLWHGYPDFTALEWIEITVVAQQLLWLGPAFYFIVRSASWFKNSKLRGDVIDVVISVYGGVMFILGGVLAFVAKAPTGEKIAYLLTPLPSLFCFLNMNDYRKDPEIAPFAIGANLVMDAVGYIGGGVELLLDTLQSKPANA